MQTPGAGLLSRSFCLRLIASAFSRGVRSVVRWLLAFLVIMPGAAMAQSKDAELKATAAKVADSLRTTANAMVPDRVEIRVRATDGRVYEWSLEIGTDVDIVTLAKEMHTSAIDRIATLDAWTDQMASKLFSLTKDEVTRASIDKDFNPECDFTLSVFHRMPAPIPDPTVRFKDHPDCYWASYTGSRRDPLRNEAGEIIRLPSKPAVTTPIRVQIEPSRAEWQFRKTIDGRISITNKGTARIRLIADWADRIRVTDPTGNQAQAFSCLGHVEGGFIDSMFKFLAPGDTITEKFSVCTDRAHTMLNGYHLAPGPWRISVADFVFKDFEVEGSPAEIVVLAEPGEYMGPRIVEAISAGHRLVLLREDGTIEAVDTTTGERLGSCRTFGADRDWLVSSKDFAVSDDGRLLACLESRWKPISLVALFGPAPARTKVYPPRDFSLGPGGFAPSRFLPRGKTLVCCTNSNLVLVDVETGNGVPQPVPEAWVEVSPDATGAVAIKSPLVSWANVRGSDACTVAVIDLRDQKNNRDVAVKGHGERPDLHAARSYAFLTDEFESSFLQIPYANQPTREVKTGGPCDFIGESSDGTLAAFAWPRASKDKDVGPTTIGVFRSSDGEQIATIRMNEASSAVFISEPPRILTQARLRVEDGFNGSEWLSESARVFDALTGEQLQTLDLTPPELVNKK